MRASRPFAFALLAALPAIAGCNAAGTGDTLSIDAIGSVGGFVFFDANGDRRVDEGDSPLAGIEVLLISAPGQDTVAQALSNPEGLYVMPFVPVGNYDLLVGLGDAADSVEVVSIDTSTVTLAKDDSVDINIAVSFPIVSIATARDLPLGTRVFVEGVALNSPGTFGDSTVNLEDPTAAIRATRVVQSQIFAGDSVRFLGTRNRRDGQPTMDQATSFFLGIVGAPAPFVVTTATAASANAGQLDAALAQVQDATIADTATVAGGLRLTTNDGSGALTVFLDDAAPFTTLAPYIPGAVIDATGVLVPLGTGTWQLHPRSDADLTVK